MRLLVAAFLMCFCMQGMAMGNCSKQMIRVQAIQEIEYLRRWYAKATDKIGQATDESVREGREIYHRIFTSDATLDAGPGREPQVGPDGWVDLVLGVLGELGPTQHLIGTQVVDSIDFELDDDCNIVSGEATMESYLQAWHEQKDEKVWLFLGVYYDKVKYVQGKGWQIHDMRMEQMAGETRYMDAAVGRAN